MTTYMFNMKTLSLRTAEKGSTVWINNKNMGYSRTIANARKKAVMLLKKDGERAYISKVNQKHAVGRVYLNWKNEGVWVSGNKAHTIYKDGSIGPGEQYME